MNTDPGVCPHCRQQVSPEDQFCWSCGAPHQVSVPSPAGAGTLTRAIFLEQTQAATRSCGGCSRQVGQEDAFCSACGTALPIGHQPDPPHSAESPPAGDMWDEVLYRLRKSTLGEYEIAGRLGSGGMAAVFLAHDIALNRKVAIKVMAPTFLVDPALVDRFKQEARTVAALRHPHIVSIHAVREVDHLHFFVMQFLAGRSLADVLKEEGPLPIPAVVAILFQVGSALAYAHRRGVIHRDIKPANIMLDDEGNAIVTDFGIAKVAETRGLTMTGGAIGTPAYMSPEQCNAAPVSGASDQYSLGVVAYELITGAPPFAGAHYAVMGAHAMEPPPPILSRRPDCPPEIAAVVTRMLAKLPDHRFPTPADAASAAGGAPLADDAPLRKELIRLALRATTRASDLHASTPASPRPSRPQVTSILLTQLPDELAVGQRVTLEAFPTDPGGLQVTNLAVTWISDAPAIASVQPNGTVVARAPGTATISAACGGLTAVSVIRVRSPRVHHVDLAPASLKLLVGRSRQVRASVVDEAGEPLPDSRVTWRSTNPSIAVVSKTGEITAVAAGRTEIIADSEGGAGAVMVVESVLPGTGSQPPATVPRVEAPRRPVPWRIVAGATVVAAVAGILIADPFNWRGPSGSAGNRGSTSTDQPTPPVTPSRLVLSPTFDTLEVRDSVTITGELQDTIGARLDGPVPLWSSDNPSVLEIQGKGSRVSLVARSAGVATLTASAGSLRQILRIVVHAAGESGFTLGASRRELVVGDSLSLEVKGAARDMAPGFRSLNPRVASVSARGVVVARAPGRVEVEATLGEARDTIALMVKSPIRGSLTLLPSSLQLEVGDTALVTGRGEGFEALTWRVSDPTRLRITPRGSNSTVVLALAVGGAEISAQSEGVSPATIQALVLPKRSLMLTAGQVTFEMAANGAPPDSRTVGVIHVGMGSIIAQDPEYSGAGGWLEREIQRDQLVLRVTADAARLSPGKYGARVVVTDGRNREPVTVTLTVNEKGPAPAPEPITASRTQLQEVIDGYVRAINAGDSNAIRRTYPTISAKGLKEVLASRSSGKYDLMLRTEPRPGSSPGTLEAQVTALYDGGKKAGAVPLIYSFAWQEGRWVIVGWKVSR